MNTNLKTADKTVDVLLAEDNPTDVFFIKEALKRCRFSIRLGVVRNGEEALAYLRHQWPYAEHPHPDLVILDLNLPRITGWEVLKEIKKDFELNPIPVVVITTFNKAADARKAYWLNADYYLVKPLNLNQFPLLTKTIERFLEGPSHWLDQWTGDPSRF